MTKVLVLHGPNLNLLGSRETAIYGDQSLDTINSKITQLAKELDVTTECFQSNAEHALIDKIQQTLTDNTAFVIFNPAAFTHTSIALRDALLAVNKPFVEVHLSNVQHREPFRTQSYFSDIAIGTITGLGAEGYLLALRYAHYFLTTKQ